MYWKGGAANFSTFVADFVAGHPELIVYLNYTRDHNPNCKSTGGNGGEHEEHGAAAAAAAATAPPAQTADSGAVAPGTISIYDAKGVHRQCSEGPEQYMKDCVMPSDYFGYMLSAEPVYSHQLVGRVHQQPWQQQFRERS